MEQNNDIEAFISTDSINYATYLIDVKGVNINSVRKRDGFSKLHHAVDNNNIDMVKFLVERGIDQKIKNNEGRVAARLESTQEIWNILIDNINEPDNDGNTLLHFCSNISDIKFLIAKGARYDIKNKEGKTAADYNSHHYYYFNNDVKKLNDLERDFIDTKDVGYMKYLLDEKKVNINILYSYNYETTAFSLSSKLHFAVRIENIEMVSALIERGIDQKIKDYYGRVAAILPTSHEIWNLLKNNINEVDSENNTILHKCCNNIRDVKFLLSLGVPYDIKNNKGQTAASLSRHPELFPKSIDEIMKDVKLLNDKDRLELVKATMSI